jgi:hypothetical protein
LIFFVRVGQYVVDSTFQWFVIDSRRELEESRFPRAELSIPVAARVL